MYEISLIIIFGYHYELNYNDFVGTLLKVNVHEYDQ